LAVTISRLNSKAEALGSPDLAIVLAMVGGTCFWVRDPDPA